MNLITSWYSCLLIWKIKFYLSKKHAKFNLLYILLIFYPYLRLELLDLLLCASLISELIPSINNEASILLRICRDLLIILSYSDSKLFANLLQSLYYQLYPFSFTKINILKFLLTWKLLLADSENQFCRCKGWRIRRK